jgi:hypothetical protein
MIRNIKILIFILFFAFPSASLGQEQKSLPIVVGTALSPLLVGGVCTAYDWVSGIVLVDQFAITAIPMISHGYIGDSVGGVKYTLLKGIGMINWITLFEADYCGENNNNCWYISGSISGALIVGTYIYEIIDLIKKTNKINKEVKDKVSLSFHSGINRNRINLGLSLSF